VLIFVAVINSTETSVLQAIASLCNCHTRASPLKCVVCGPKDVGKSTFCQRLCNELLQSDSVEEVAFLEADCGQPAQGPPCFVSLSYCRCPRLVPPSLGTGRPDKSAFVGDTSAHSHPLLYLQSITKLLREYAAKVDAGVSVAIPACPVAGTIASYVHFA
jgi:polynucleotide 5'-kinase involved in rRNA processing